MLSQMYKLIANPGYFVTVTFIQKPKSILSDASYCSDASSLPPSTIQSYFGKWVHVEPPLSEHLPSVWISEKVQISEMNTLLWR